MKLRILVLLVATHGLVGVVGFGAGIYALPILTAPPAPSESEITAMFSTARYTAEFKRDLKDSDALHPPSTDNGSGLLLNNRWRIGWVKNRFFSTRASKSMLNGMEDSAFT
jgi:hypothetical protein